MLLTNTHDSKFLKFFASNFEANIKLSKTRLHKIGQSEGFLGKLLGPLLKTELLLIRNVLKLLAKSVLISLAAALAADTTIHKNILRSGVPTLIISNEEMNAITKIT